MIIPQAEEMTGARVQAMMVTTGLFTFVSIGIVACIGLVVALFYLLASFILLMLQAIAEVFSSMALTWNTADPFCKILIVGAVVYGSYRLYQSRSRKQGGGKYAQY